jgi:hypothetical protein
MSRTIIVSFFLVVLATVTTAQDQNDPLAGQRALRRELKAAAEQRFPKATVTWSDLDTTDEIECHLELLDLSVSDIISSISYPDTSNIEQLAREFMNKLLPSLKLDLSTLVGVSKRDLPWGHEGVGLEVGFSQCFEGIPVEYGHINFRIEARKTRLRIRGVLKQFSLDHQAAIESDSAIKSVEQFERNRYEDGLVARPVYSYGIVSNLVHAEYYEIADSAGQWIPYADRVLGSELIIHSGSSTGRTKPTLAWRIGYGLGDRILRDMYLIAYVDARSGHVLELRNFGGGCIVFTWEARSCTN